MLINGREIGRITNGAYSPTLDASIAMAYVPSRIADELEVLDVNLNGRSVKAEVVDVPFLAIPRQSQVKNDALRAA